MDKENSAAAQITAILEPGMYVRNPNAPEWGRGQVQSNIAGRVTVNFEHEGKLVLDGHKVALSIDYSS